jgi:hypothetical protein
MDYLRRLQMERPVLFWILLLVGFLLVFRLLLYVAAVFLGPFGLPPWVPIAVVMGVLVLVARHQQRSR